MDRRIEEITRTGGELAADYVEQVLTATTKLTDALLRNVTTLARGVIEDGTNVVVAACEAFLPDDSEQTSDEL
jgi:hypothetical protein